MWAGRRSHHDRLSVKVGTTGVSTDRDKCGLSSHRTFLSVPCSAMPAPGTGQSCFLGVCVKGPRRHTSSPTRSRALSTSPACGAGSELRAALLPVCW